MMNHIYRFLYLVYVTIWLLSEYKYFHQIEYSPLAVRKNFDLINELILGNFLFGSIGILISLLLMSYKKTGIYFIFTCAIGLAIAVGTLYLDSSVTGNAAQAHMNSVLALVVWMIPVVLSGWMGILKDLVAAINHKRDGRK
jgi:hypothetical protein